MWLLDFAEGQLSEVSALPVPCAQALASLSGDLASLPAQLAAVAAQGSAERPVWLEVRVRGDDYLSDLAARVAALADGLPVEILRVRRERGDAVASLSADPGDTLDALSPLEVFERRLAQETLTPEQHDGLLSRYRQVLAELAETA
jgi:exonuclease SbcD